MSAEQKLFSGFSRLRDFPLDPSCIYKKLTDAQYYVEHDRTAYVGQVLAIVADTEEISGLYYINENKELVNTVNLAKVREEIAAANQILAAALRKEIATADEQVKSDINKQLQELKGEFTGSLSDLNSKVEAADQIIHDLIGDADEKIAALNKALELLKDDGKLTESLDSIAEITEWLKKHGDDFDNLNAVIDKGKEDIAKLQEESVDLDTRLTKIEEHGSTNEEEVRALAKEEIQIALGSGNIKTADKNLLIDIELNDTGKIQYQAIPCGDVEFDTGDVIKSIHIDVLNRPSVHENFYITLTKQVKNSEGNLVDQTEELVRTFEEFLIPGEEDQEIIRVLDFTNGECYGFDLCHTVESGGFLTAHYLGTSGKIRIRTTYFKN